MNDSTDLSRRKFLAGSAIAAAGAVGVAGGFQSAQASGTTKGAAGTRGDAGGPYNILMIVTDQERYLTADELPAGYRLPGRERLAQRGVVFENHQIGSCVCTPSRAVIYTGQHIQNNGMFDNTNFSWSGSMSTEIDTIGDLLRKQGYYTAYKGKWHLTQEFETANELHAPKKILVDEMEAYGFSDYFGIGDVIGHTEGGYLHDDVISAGARSWLRGQGQALRDDDKPWFMAVNLINPHDVMYYNTDLPGQSVQSGSELMHLNREPANALYQNDWDLALPQSREQGFDDNGRPGAHLNFRNARGALCGIVPIQDEALGRLNNYYLNCLRDVDNKLVQILDELDDLGLAESTIILFTADHGELGGAHGLTGKGANAYREQNNVPLTIVHPAYAVGKRCKAVTSHVDIATTLIGLAGGSEAARSGLPGKDISTLLQDPEAAQVDTLREGALYNYNMIGFVDDAFFTSISNYFAKGGLPAELPNQGFRPDLSKRGAIRTVYDGRYKFSRYFSPLQHHVPKSLEELYAYNDVELFDVVSDPLEINNLAVDMKLHGDVIEMMNNKLNRLIEREVGDDAGQMLPRIKGQSWRLDPSFKDLRL
ncbi:MAG: sulfatase-like hydrolase/transferase [Halioglobus sp.]